MAIKVKITPKFQTKKITDETIGKDWIDFQLHAFNTGQTLLKYLQSYINSNRKRSGGTGSLANTMTLDVFSTTGKVHWGIGHIPTLNSTVPYWYVINYGKKVGGEDFIPGGGKYRPVKFTDGDADPSKRGSGTAKATKMKRITGDEPIPSVIRPIHYIESTYDMLKLHMNNLLARFKRSK